MHHSQDQKHISRLTYRDLIFSIQNYLQDEVN